MRFCGKADMEDHSTCPQRPCAEIGAITRPGCPRLNLWKLVVWGDAMATERKDGKAPKFSMRRIAPSLRRVD